VTCLTSHAQSRVATLGEIVDVLYGKDHKKIPCGAIPIFGSGGVMRYGATAIFDKPSVLIPRKGSIGNVMYVDEPFWTVDTMFYTRFKLPNMEKILYYQLCDYNLASMSTGAAVPSMTTAILNSLEIEVPSDDLREKFDLAVEPMFEQKRLLKKQNTALAAARDMLLPRLMKGEMV
jgi:type I restriction enzyme S subunit